MTNKLLVTIALICCASLAHAQRVSSGGGSGGLSSITFPQTVGGVTHSGGIPYLDSTTSLSSSNTLTLNSLLVGGGAGGAPSSVTTGLNVLTTLAAAINSAGGIIAPVPATPGDIAIYNGTNWVIFSGNAGSAKYFQEAGGIPTWTSSPSAGVTSYSETCPPTSPSGGDIVNNNGIFVLNENGTYASTMADCGSALKFTLTTSATYTLPAPSTGFYPAAITNVPSSTNPLTIATSSGNICSSVCSPTYSLAIGKTISLYPAGTNYYVSDSSNFSLPPLNIGYISGKWSTTAINYVPAAGGNWTAGVVHCDPYIVSPPGITAKAIGVYVSTPDASNYISMAIYSNGPSGYPLNLIDSIGTTGLSPSSAGGLSGTLSNTTDFLSPGAVWTCVIYNSATVVINGSGLGAISVTGSSTVAGAIGASSAGNTGYACTGGNSGCGPAWTAGSGSSYTWPSSFTPSWGTLNNGSQAPAVVLQAN
jgi:hypothetical protein